MSLISEEYDAKAAEIEHDLKQHTQYVTWRVRRYWERFAFIGRGKPGGVADYVIEYKVRPSGAWPTDRAYAGEVTVGMRVVEQAAFDYVVGIVRMVLDELCAALRELVFPEGAERVRPEASDPPGQLRLIERER